MEDAAGDDGLRSMVEAHVEALEDAPPRFEDAEGLLDGRAGTEEGSIEGVLGGRAGGVGGERGEEEGQERVAPVADDVGPDVMAADGDDVPAVAVAVAAEEELAGGEAVVEERFAEVGGVIGGAGGLDADVPEHFPVVGDSLEVDNGGEGVADGPERGGVSVGGEAAEGDRGGVDGATDVGEGGGVPESAEGVGEAGAGGRPDEGREEAGGEEAGYGVGGAGDGEGVEAVAAG